MESQYQIDNTDRKILACLMKDARMPYLEIAKKLNVSGGTIHQRMQKMQEAGIISGSHLKVNLEALNFDVMVILGVFLKSAKDQTKVVKELEKLPEVLEIYYTTGNFALMLKLVTKNIKDFHLLLSQKIQSIAEIQSTESFIVLDSPLNRDIDVSAL